VGVPAAAAEEEEEEEEGKEEGRERETRWHGMR
jgi:hypothetical protein